MRTIYIPINHEELKSLEGKLVNVSNSLIREYFFRVYDGIDNERYKFIDIDTYLLGKNHYGNKDISVYIEDINSAEFRSNGIFFPKGSYSRRYNIKENHEKYNRLKRLIEQNL